jgi:hypothetical protein
VDERQFGANNWRRCSNTLIFGGGLCNKIWAPSHRNRRPILSVGFSNSDCGRWQLRDAIGMISSGDRLSGRLFETPPTFPLSKTGLNCDIVETVAR